MRLVYSIAIILMLSSNAILASNDIERLDAAFKIYEKKYKQVFEEKAPEIAKLLPKISLDNEFEKALQCFLNELEASQGRQGVEKYLNDYEVFVQQNFTSVRQLTGAPTGLPVEQAMQTNKACGITALSLKRMQDSGYNKIYSDPKLLEQLTELFSAPEPS